MAINCELCPPFINSPFRPLRPLNALSYICLLFLRKCPSPKSSGLKFVSHILSLFWFKPSWKTPKNTSLMGVTLTPPLITYKRPFSKKIRPLQPFEYPSSILSSSSPPDAYNTRKPRYGTRKISKCFSMHSLYKDSPLP